jgi:uncharacterized protein (DUF488 family)
LRRAVYTVGHSNHTIDAFLRMLDRYEITAIADVRSAPFSRANPQFDRGSLERNLEARKIVYAALGKQLGARSENVQHYIDDKISYDLLGRSISFRHGIERVVKGCEKFRIALMCAEGEPVECHRAILIARHLENMEIEVRHILRSGECEDHENSMRRLANLLGLSKNLVITTEAELFSECYRIQGQRIAYDRRSSASMASRAGSYSS